MNGIKYKELIEQDISAELFRQFDRYQEVSRCWRKIDGAWCIRDIAYTEQWNPGDYKRLVYSLIQTLRSGGTVLGAFKDATLVGFAAVENTLFGKHSNYLELSYFHVTYGLRRGGIGRQLFELSCQRARRCGAVKLYISAHSSVETQAFYRAMGCVEAEESYQQFIDREPCDVQLEYQLF